MNHLAHALLAGSDDGLRLGGLMGDFVRGGIDTALPAEVQQGIALHRAIDSYTDQHEDVRAARALFEPPYRRYAGILIDIWFDHLLAREFARWSGVPLPRFSDDLQQLLVDSDILLPVSLRRFRDYMHARSLPAAYANREMISEVLSGVSFRLRRENPLAQGLVEISRLEHELGQAYARFFPQLLGFATAWRANSQANGKNNVGRIQQG
jgi:acyl carrier protein phosphodiesterase